MNPLTRDNDILPSAEIRRLLAKCRAPLQGKGNDGRFKCAETITMTDVAREAQIACRSRLFRLAKNDPNCDLGPVPLRRISRFLTRVEHGLVAKCDGKIVYLNEPTRKPDHVLHVVLTKAGARLQFGAATPIPKSMPSFFKDFKFPKRR